MKTHSLFLDFNGKVYSCGRNKEVQLGVGDYEDRCDITLITHNSLT